ncbi:MAG: hypothetical protein OHK0046_38680 [Anaerolineae bacterium]
MASNQLRFFFLITLIVFLLGMGTPILGQDDTIIQIALPTWLTTIIDDDIFERFEQQNPGIHIVVEGVEDYYFTTPAADPDAHFDELYAYAQQADVLYIAPSTISQFSTDTGYLLDLSPLMQSETSFNLDDFHPAMIDAFQWNNGTWAVPIFGSPVMLLYDRTAFDAIGLQYPNSNWTFDDFASVAIALTEFDANGDPIAPGVPLLDPSIIYTIFNPDAPLIDTTQFPTQPAIYRPELLEFFSAYLPLFDETMPMGGNFNNRPLQVAKLTQRYIVETDQGQDWQIALLPGNSMQMDVTGLAVSAGTQHPEVAFELINYLTSDPAFVQSLAVQSYPARRSVVEADEFSYIEFQEDERALFEVGLERAIPTSQTHYFRFIQPVSRGLQDMGETLTSAQLQAEAVLSMALERRSNSQVIVEPADSLPDIGNNQSILHFGVSTPSGNVINQSLWNDVIADFIANNPHIDHVELTTLTNIADAESQDCYTLLRNPTRSDNIGGATLLSVDPLMMADPDFDPNDFIGDTLAQVSRDGMILVYPLTIQPMTLRYNRMIFAQADIPEPSEDWSIDAFVDVLQRLSQRDPQLTPRLNSGRTILMLTAVFGGRPYDLSTEPPVFSLTDPVNAIPLRQALDLVRDGLLTYERIELLGDNPEIITGAAITTDSILGTSEGQMLNFPSGSIYTPVSYVVTTALINRDATEPQACYDFIDLVSRTPGMIPGIPVRQSLLEDPLFTAAFGQDRADSARAYVEQISATDAVNFPDTSGGAYSLRTLLEQMWMHDLFNRYVLDGENFDTLLTETESNILAYRECTANVDQTDVRELTDCVVAISPEFSDEFSWIYGDGQ